MQKENWIYRTNETGKGGFFVVDENTDYEAYDWIWGATKEEAVENYKNNKHQD